MAKRIFDVTFSLVGLLILSPFLILISLLVKVDSRGSVFYRQNRVGLHSREFRLYKFRTMKIGAEKFGLLTVGDRDSRITRVGFWLRKYKLDELPQLFNIVKGDMSFVGPRPEVMMYVTLYTDYQRRVLSVRPGITDWASILYIHENCLLANTENPENFYVTNVLPSKLSYNLKYIDQNNLWIDMKIIALTCFKIFSKQPI